MVIASTKIGLWDWNLVTNEIYFSPEWKHQLGYNPDEVEDRFQEWESRVHPQDLPIILAKLNTYLYEAIPNDYHVEFRLRHRDGTYRWIMTQAVALRDEHGKALRMFGTHIDITRYKQAEEQLSSIQELQHAFFENSPAAAFVSTLDGQIEMVNAAWEQFFNLKREQVLNLPIDKIFPPQVAQSFMESNQLAVETGQLISFERTIPTQTGVRYTRVIKFPLRDKNGKIILVGGLSMDVTSTRVAETALRQSQETALALLNASTDRAYLLDPQGIVLAANRLGKEYYRDRADRIEGQCIYDLMPPETAALRRFWMLKAIETRSMVRFEDEINEQTIDSVINPILDENGQVVQLAVYARDISERIHSERIIRLANHELSEAYEATLEGWARALELREQETAGHSHRVVMLAIRLAEKLGMDATDCVHVRRGALLHDIGKMAIPDDILLKPGPLTEAEWVIMRRHPDYAYRLLADIGYLRPALVIPYCHHERWNGSGYPRGLAGEGIPLPARLFAVVDVWDALNAARPYRPPWPPADARQYLVDYAGILFDPRVVAAFLELLEEDPDTARLND